MNHIYEVSGEIDECWDIDLSLRISSSDKTRLENLTDLNGVKLPMQKDSLILETYSESELPICIRGPDGVGLRLRIWFKLRKVNDVQDTNSSVELSKCLLYLQYEAVIQRMEFDQYIPDLKYQVIDVKNSLTQVSDN